MFKSYRSPYSTKRKQKFQPWSLVLSVLGGLILLEGLSWMLLKFATPGRRVTTATTYQLQFFNEKQQPIPSLPHQGKLLAEPSSFMGYQILDKKQQRSEIWQKQINEQGFRDNDPISLDKPKNEIRIFLLGSSTAFGQGFDKNEDTLANLLETRLKKRLEQQKNTPGKYRPDVLPFDATGRAKALKLPLKLRSGNYRVINAAVPGYTSGNQLAQLALKLLPYQPDAIILLNGYTDLILPEGREAAEVPYLTDFLNQPWHHLWSYLSKPIEGFFVNTNFWQFVAYQISKNNQTSSVEIARSSIVLEPNSKPLVSYLPTDNKALEQRITRYYNHLQQIARLCAGAEIPLILALQPEITGISPEQQAGKEKVIAKALGPEYNKRLEEGFGKIVEVNKRVAKNFPKSVKFFNYYRLYDNLKAEAFTDAIHLTKPGNEALGEKLYSAVTSLPELQVLTPEPGKR